MFSGASNLAAGVDQAFALILIISAVFVVGITALMIYIIIKNNRKKSIKPKQFRGNAKLELIWTIGALAIVLVIFYYGYVGFAPMRNAPGDAMEITAIGRKWEWEFKYENGKSSKELVIPKDKPVKLNLVSEDVNHSLFIPAFRVKEDVVPGYDNYLWFTPQYIGNYEVLCTEYCGLLHSSMTSETRVVEKEEFEEWYADLSEQKEEKALPGKALVQNKGCTACHSLSGRKLVGPSFKGVYGTTRTVIVDGEEKQVTVDDEYIATSIYEPDKELVKGFRAGLMQSYQDSIDSQEMDQIIEYLKSIQ